MSDLGDSIVWNVRKMRALDRCGLLGRDIGRLAEDVGALLELDADLKPELGVVVASLSECLETVLRAVTFLDAQCDAGYRP